LDKVDAFGRIGVTGIFITNVFGSFFNNQQMVLRKIEFKNRVLATNYAPSFSFGGMFALLILCKVVKCARCE
jgi:hypothetical protein